jgi:hypothetical protein
MSANRIALVFDRDGCIDHIVTDGEVEILNINDFVPGDRVYRWTIGMRVDTQRLDELIGDSPIGTLEFLPGGRA